jgi:hypothetical protein
MPGEESASRKRGRIERAATRSASVFAGEDAVTARLVYGKQD